MVSVCQVPVRSCFVSEWNPRKHLDPADVSSLAEGIRQVGCILEPLLARMWNESGAASYEVVAGQKRLAAAKSLGLESVPVIVKSLSDVEAAVVALLENLDRSDLSPVDEAAMFARLREEKGLSVPVLAERVHRSPSYVYRRLSLMALPVAAREMVSSGDIPLQVAARVCGYVEPFLSAAAERLVAAAPVNQERGLRILAEYEPRMRAEAWRIGDGEEMPLDAGEVAAFWDEEEGVMVPSSRWVRCDETPLRAEVTRGFLAGNKRIPSWGRIAALSGLDVPVRRAVVMPGFLCLRLMDRELVVAAARQAGLKILRRVPVSADRGRGVDEGLDFERLSGLVGDLGRCGPVVGDVGSVLGVIDSVLRARLPERGLAARAVRQRPVGEDVAPVDVLVRLFAVLFPDGKWWEEPLVVETVKRLGVNFKGS